jgi:hypothetical protein
MRVFRISLVCLLLATAGCTMQTGKPGETPIPDAGSPAARLYVRRCGPCHAVPHPARLAYPGWVQMLSLMERRMAESGMRPLSDAERNEILGYLKAHAR